MLDEYDKYISDKAFATVPPFGPQELPEDLIKYAFNQIILDGYCLQNCSPGCPYVFREKECHDRKAQCYIGAHLLKDCCDRQIAKVPTDIHPVYDDGDRNVIYRSGTCSFCGAEVHDDEKYCSQCGTKLLWKEKSE